MCNRRAVARVNWKVLSHLRTPTPDRTRPTNTGSPVTWILCERPRVVHASDFDGMGAFA